MDLTTYFEGGGICYTLEHCIKLNLTLCKSVIRQSNGTLKCTCTLHLFGEVYSCWFTVVYNMPLFIYFTIKNYQLN